jgi:dynein heavy chain, axonemal
MLAPASKRMNWLTIGVMDFVNRCNVAIDKFASIVHQLQKNIEDIEQRLAIIESGNLFKHAPRNSLGELPGCEDYFDYVVKRRAADVKALVRSYQDIGQILIKVCISRSS